MKLQDIAKLLANKINQEHYIMQYLEKVQRGAYNKGLEDGQLTKKDVPDSDFYCGRAERHPLRRCSEQCGICK